MCTVWGRMQMQVLAKLLRQRWPHAADALPRRRRCDASMVSAGHAWSAKGHCILVPNKLWEAHATSLSGSRCAPALRQPLAVPGVRAGSDELAPYICFALARMWSCQLK